MSSRPGKRILVLRYRFIGDTILTVPFLRNLRLAEPDAFIAWVITPGTADVVAGIPYVDELIFWDPVTIHADSRGTHRTLKDKLGFIRMLRARKFTKVYVLKRSLSSAIMGLLCGAGERVGFNTEGRGFLLTRRVPYRQDCHEVENFLNVLRADGVRVADDQLEVWISPPEEEEARAILAKEGVAANEKLVALHLFSSIPQRGWPHEDFAALARQFHGRGYRLLILGGPNDRGAFADIAELFPAGTVNMVGNCSLRITMALLRRCSLFVGNDSGVMHLAAATGIPLVALFGPQSPLKFGPWGEKTAVIYKGFACSPCRQKFFTECEPSQRNRPACVEAITVAEVLAAACRLLGEEGKG